MLIEPKEKRSVVASPSDGVGIQSIETGMAVLTAVGREARPQPLAAIARSCAITPTKAHRYLLSLQRTGYVEREPASGHYRLGAASLQLGLSAVALVDFARLASELLPTISADIGESIFISIWSENGATIVRWEDAGQPIAVNVRVGSTMPLIRSATGQVFGAFLPAEMTRPFLERELSEKPVSTPVRTLSAAKALFVKVRQTGLGLADGSFQASVAGLSVPVFGERGALAGALTVLGLRGSFSLSDDGHVATSLRKWSALLSARLGALVVDRLV